MSGKVLLVDDEPDFVQLAEYALVRQGYEVYAAASGVEALHQARRVLPDVILLDLMLPDIDGVSVCEILRAQPSTTDVPVIVVSALDGIITRDRSAGAGARTYFKKPVDLRALSDCVRSVVDQRQALLKSRLSDKEV